MADTSNLSNFLSDVADAIRTKKETTEPIAAEDFDTEILSIESGVMTQEDYNTCDELATEILGDAIVHTELEWLQNTGTQYIDTGITPDSDVDIELSFIITGGNHFGRLWGTYGEDCKYELANWAWDLDSCRISIGGTTNQYIFDVSTTEFNVVKMTGMGECYYNGELIHDFAKSYTGAKPILLFSGYGAYGLAKIAYCKIWKDGELVRDLVPVKDANNIVCMFDKTNYIFYYSQATGEFIGGGEK